MSHKEQLHHCLAWIDAHDCHEAVSTVSVLMALPCIYVARLDDLRKLFPGRSAKKTREGSQWHYEIVVDGIRFIAWEWEQTEPSAETSEVLL